MYTTVMRYEVVYSYSMILYTINVPLGMYERMTLSQGSVSHLVQLGRSST
jgi:hypothetical protein